MVYQVNSLFVCTIFALLLSSCGVIVVDSDTSSSQQTFVNFEIYEINRHGSLNAIYSDCINLRRATDEGSVYIETAYWQEDLSMHWRQDYSEIVFAFEDRYTKIASSSFDRQYFLRGQSSEIAIGTGFSNYLVRFSGPYCKDGRFL